MSNTTPSDLQMVGYSPTKRKFFSDGAIDLKPEMAGVIFNPGAQASNLLNVSDIVVAEEILTIGAGDDADIFEVNVVNTDTSKVTTAALNTTQTRIPVQTGHGVEVGDVILIDTTEFCMVVAAAALELTVIRGWGLAPAAHDTGATVFKGAAYTAGRIPVPLNKTTVTAESFINHFVYLHSLLKLRGMLKASAAITLYKLTAALVLAVVDEPGVSTLATTEGFTNAAWRAATMASGSKPGMQQIITLYHTVTAQDVTNGKIYLPIPAEPTFMIAQVWLATGIEKAQWNGVLAYVAGPPKQITLDNAGTADWADTDVIRIIAVL